MFNTIVGAGAVGAGAGAAPHYITGSAQMMQLQLRNTFFWHFRKKIHKEKII
jgi:hypothetical protein